MEHTLCCERVVCMAMFEKRNAVFARRVGFESRFGLNRSLENSVMKHLLLLMQWGGCHDLGSLGVSISHARWYIIRAETTWRSHPQG